MNVEELLARELQQASASARKAEQELDIAVKTQAKAVERVVNAQLYEAELQEALELWREQ
jgi:hypothetical protein